MSENNIGFLQELEATIDRRKGASPDESYTATLLAGGRARIAQKVGEEGVELAIAGVLADREGMVNEAADLIYHMLVLLRDQDLALNDVASELKRRHG